jgi:centrosomal protein CEP104
VANVKNEDLEQLFKNKLEEVKLAKDQAANIDDYDKARTLRDAYDRIKDQGVRVIKLMELKRTAVDNEDYETAKRIRDEVDKIRSAVASIDVSNGGRL